ncbi:MAG: RING-HC finger protein [Janthinobacterium lividum]
MNSLTTVIGTKIREDIDAVTAMQSLKKFINHSPTSDFVELDLRTEKSTRPTVSLPSLTGSCVPDDLLCKICYTERLEVLFRPCGHLTACIQCAITFDECSICRQSIYRMMRIGVHVEMANAESEYAICAVCKHRPIQTVRIPCLHASTCLRCTENEHRCYLCAELAYAYLYVYI